MIRPTTVVLFSVAVLTSLASSYGSEPSYPGVVGTWLTEEGKARVEIFECDTLLCGRIVWARQQAESTFTLLDIHNPDAVLRERPVIGLLILSEFSRDGKNRWAGGTVYDPESGNSYRATMELMDRNTLDLRGYILFPLFGRTTTWTRVEQH